MYSNYCSLVDSSKTWHCELHAKGYVSQPSLDKNGLPIEVPVDANLCQLMSNCAVICPLLSYPMSHFMFNPRDVKGCTKDSINKMYNLVQTICKEAGFYASPTNACSRKPDQYKHALLEFACEHKKKKGHSTENEITCPFRIRVFCFKGNECWYLSPQTVYTSCPPSLHQGHHRLMAKDVRTPLNAIDHHDIQLAMQCNDICLSQGLISKLISLRTAGGNSFVTRKQIDYLLLKHDTSSVFNTVTENSPAELLLQHFDKMIEQGLGVNYVALVHSVQDSFKICQPHGRPSKSVDADYYPSIMEIRHAMQIHDNQDVLLAFAWTTDVEISMLLKFPELLTMDVTEKTNKEKRGLFMVVGQDGNGSIFTAMHCFMPNARFESYQWIYSYAASALWPPDVIKQIECIITDGEPALYSPLENEIRMGTIWNKGTAVYRCTFHLFSQYWCKYIAGSETEGTTQDEIIKGVKYWIETLIHQFMYKYQFHESIEKLSLVSKNILR